MRPKEHLLHGRDSKGKFLTLTPTYAEKVKTFEASLQVSFVQLWTPDIFIENLRDMRGPDDTYYFVKPISMYVGNHKCAKFRHIRSFNTSNL